MQQRDVEFKVEYGPILRGWLKTPEGPGPHPLIVMAHGNGGHKEWTIPWVADRFVEAGYAALAFDYRNFGDSDGEPREEVDHAGRIDDWRTAITFGLTLAEVDPARIAIWGTSLGGRDVLIVAALDRRIKAVVAQVPAIDWRDTVLHHQNNVREREALQKIWDADRLARFKGETPEYTQFQTVPGTELAAFFDTLTAADKKNWKQRLTYRSYEPSVASNALPFVHMISPTPLLMVLVDRDIVTPTQGQLEAYEKALEPKSYVLYPGRHYDVYGPLKEKATQNAIDWFDRHVK